MDKVLRNWLYKNIKVGGVEYNVWEILFLAGITVVGIMIRYSLKAVVSVDYSYFLANWVEEFKHRGFGVIKEDFYNYNPPYMVILYIISVLKINTLTAIKVVSCVFDMISAITIATIVKEISKNKFRIMAAYAAAWILPTVVANGSMWAQCDSIYTSFIMLSIYFMLKERPARSMIFYGIAFSFKLQTLFILPAFIILWAKKRMKLSHFLYIPMIYFISLLPAIFAGKSLQAALGLYMGQAKEGKALSYNWPGIYEIFGVDGFYEYFGSAAMCLVLGVLMCIMFYLAYRNYELTQARMIDIYFYIAMVSLYFLPHMHERYGYVAGMIAIVAGVIHPQKIYIPIVHMIASYGAYQAWLTDHRVVPFWIYSFMLLYLIVDYGIYIYKDIKADNLSNIAKERKTKSLSDILYQEYQVGSIRLTLLHILLAIGMTVVGLAMRYFMLNYESNHYLNSWKPWIMQMQDLGLKKGLAGEFYHYSPLLIVIVFLLSYLPIPLLFLIKGLLVISDILMAILCGAIIFDITKNSTKAIGIYGIIMILPTVAVNSAMNGKMEVLCTTFILSAFYFIMKNKPVRGMFFYGISFMLGIQSLFVFPVLIILWVLKKIDIKQFLFMPLMYFVGIVPALLAGRKINTLGFTDIWNFGKMSQLSVSYPNIYHILGTGDFVEVYSKAGIWTTLGFMLTITFFIIGKKSVVTKRQVIQLVLLFVLTAVCFLPFMRASYAFLADVTAVILAFVYEKKFYIPLFQVLISFSADAIMLTEYINVPIILYSFLSLFLIFDILKEVYKDTFTLNKEGTQVKEMKGIRASTAKI